MTLAAQIASDVEEVLLNTSDMSESVSFYPAGGTSRSIVVNVEPTQRFVAGQVLDEEIERLVLFCSKDATDGIETPVAGDTVLRSGGDPKSRFAFNGNILDEGTGWWLLEFTRPKAVRIGNQHFSHANDVQTWRQ